MSSVAFLEVSSKRPVGIYERILRNEDKKRQWQAFCNKNRDLVVPATLEQVCSRLVLFCFPYCAVWWAKLNCRKSGRKALGFANLCSIQQYCRVMQAARSHLTHDSQTLGIQDEYLHDSSLLSD